MLQIVGDTRWKRFLSAVDALELRFPVAEIAEKTNYKKGTVSFYLKKEEPSENFLRTFCAEYNIPFESIWNGVESAQKKSGNAPDFEAKYRALAVDYVELVRVKLHEFNCDDVLRNIEEIQAVLKQVVQQAAQGSAADSKFSASYPKDGSTDSNPEGHS